MKTELTAAEIDELYAFVEKKGVKPLDVQIELVDHLASDIEDILSHSPQVTFVEALLQVHAKFGRWGFDYLVQQAEDNARRRQEKLFWMLFRDFFRWPKAVFTITLTLLLWWGFDKGYFSKDVREVLVPALLVLFFGYAGFVVVRHRRMKKTVTVAMPPFWMGSCAQIPSLLNFFLGSLFQGLPAAHFVVFATFLIVMSILCTWATIEVYERMRVEGKRLYPQAFA
ncbi:hypothetical protein [Runella salmonicolor]|uniref:Uncharacterized protein n=1 Tax=Runella salmonicolor TaxID=2950278 RepID=A0ABT1FWT7_9BACT|nr:hypothetical protein [Runella salmonicolor]MCP1386171.1 hypothetical protein [Runella salmonicolor]